MSDNNLFTPVSEHDLNAWIDGELVEPECSEVAAAVAACPQLASRAGALQALKGLLQRAYAADSIGCGDAAGKSRKTASRN